MIVPVISANAQQSIVGEYLGTFSQKCGELDSVENFSTKITIVDAGNEIYSGVFIVSTPQGEESFAWNGVYKDEVVFFSRGGGAFGQMFFTEGQLKLIDHDIFPTDDPCAATGIFVKQ